MTQFARWFNQSQILYVLCLFTFFIITVISPPALMDDVDSVTAQIARTMVESGDWITPRLNGIAYFEKPALRFWIVAVSYLIFGIHDWAARIPIALSAVLVCWLVSRIGRWAFGEGAMAGIVLATSVGMFLFTRILLPDVVLTLTTTFAIWSFARALDEEESQPRLWASWFAISLGLGFMLKGLIAFVISIGAGLIYLIITKQVFTKRAWQRVHPISGMFLIALICVPWIALSIWNNPPYFDFTMKSEPGKYHGFFWFFFLNEHLFRYLNMRYPRDYNTVPRAAFWLYHLLWLFPWSVYFPFVAKLSFKPLDRAGKMRLLCLCWIGFTLMFFTFSTTQEYYSMPCYPAFALLLGAAMREPNDRMIWATRTIGAVAILAAIACCALLWIVRDIAVTGDISDALNNQISTLSLGKLGDLTITTFAWLRMPLILAALGFFLGAIGGLWKKGTFAIIGLVLMMLVFFNASRLAMVTLNSHLGSHSIAEALSASPPGQLIVDDQYYAFSSVFFYAPKQTKNALLLNGRKVNLEYGSYAPNAPNVFLNDQELVAIWNQTEQKYLAIYKSAIPRIIRLCGTEKIFVVHQSGGKLLLSNHPLPNTISIAQIIQ